VLEVRRRATTSPTGRISGGSVCPQCKNPPTNYFKDLSTPAYDRACDHARRGEKDAALAALEEALKGGVDLEIVDSDPRSENCGAIPGSPRS
jgi:hypothetical protein